MTTIRVSHHYRTLQDDRMTACGVVNYALDEAGDSSDQIRALNERMERLGEIVGRMMERNIPAAEWLDVAGIYSLTRVRE